MHGKGKEKQQSQGGGKPPTASKKKGGDESQQEKTEQKLQAILLADSFTKTFRPITWETPKVLLPLVNVPMLEYTIEFLAQNGVEELFVFCVWHADMLQTYLNSSKWHSTILVRCITSTACLSAGDALRELDSMGVIRSDPFILISGDVISNMDLKKAIAFHKEKRKTDNNCIMTVALKQVQRVAGAKPLLDDLVVGMDRITSQVILFENNYKKENVHVPLEIMNDHPGATFRFDLLDCHVDICSPELMLQFSDNFDYQNIRRDFIQNEVVNWDLGMHIYGYLLQNEYAARVHDLRTYHCICRDIVNRWVYPLVPDAQLLPDASYVHTKRCTYKESPMPGKSSDGSGMGSKIARSAHVGEGVVLGRGCDIRDHVVLERTVVGRGCVVKERAVVVESHLWTGAIVEEDAVVEQAIICDKAVVKKGAHVGRGCVVSYGAVVGAGVILPDYTRVSCLRRSLSSEEEDACGSFKPKSTLAQEGSLAYDVKVLGPDGIGFIWTNEGQSGDYEEDDDDEEEGEEMRAIEGVSEMSGRRSHVLDPLRSSSMGCTEEEEQKRRLWQVVAVPVVEDDEDDYEDDDKFDQGYDDGAMSFGYDDDGDTVPSRSTTNNSDITTEGGGGISRQSSIMTRGKSERGGGISRQPSMITRQSSVMTTTTTDTLWGDYLRKKKHLGSGEYSFHIYDEHLSYTFSYTPIHTLLSIIHLPSPSVVAFVSVISDMVTTGHAEGLPPGNGLLMEIKGYKFAQNKSFSDCICGCVPSVLSIAVAAGTSSSSSGSNNSGSTKSGSIQVAIVTFLKNFLMTGKGWGYQLLHPLLQDTNDELTLVEAVESYVLLESNEQTLFPVFRLILQMLYDEELVTEDALMLWIAKREEEGPTPTSPEGKLFRQPQVQAFVEWLQEEEEDDDEDEDDEEEEGEE